VEQVLEGAIAPATWRAYQRAWLEFLAYCRDAEVGALPAEPETVASYLIALASTPRPRLARRAAAAATRGLPASRRGALPSISLLEQHVAAISTLHQWAKHASPCDASIVRAALRGIKRERATAGDRPQPKAAARAPLVRRMLDGLDPSDPLLYARDRALLLLLAERGIRRSEAAGFDLGDVEPLPDGDGWVLHVRVSKTDPTGSHPRRLALHYRLEAGAYCAAQALTRWLEVRGTTDPAQPLFVGTRRGRLVTWDRWGGLGRLRPAGVGEVVKRAGATGGLGEEEVSRLGAHSLRRGKITDDARAGVPVPQIAHEVGHGSLNTTMGYVEAATVEDRNAWTSAGARIARAGA